MAEHRGTSFFNSCVKVPVDPYSRQPTPSYERPRLSKNERSHCRKIEGGRKINFASGDSQSNVESKQTSPRETLGSFLDFLESIPDYGQVHHLSNEQFKQKVEYLKRKQRLFLRNLNDSLDDCDKDDDYRISTLKNARNEKAKQGANVSDLKLNGKKCYFEESRTSSPILYPSGSFSCLAENQDLLTYNRYRDRDKETKTIRNNEIHAASKSWSTCSDSKSDESIENDIAENIETKSLPPCSSKQWHPTVPKPFSFTLREEAEKYMTLAELDAARHTNQESNRKSPSRKRRIRQIPLTSKIPLYDKLLAEKEERSRMIREESALNLMSQVRPFKLECDRRAWRSLTRSSPEVSGKSTCTNARFKAKPVPKNLFGTQIYDRMLEDEYYRQLSKRLRAVELMKSSSLPPSMARRERVKSACTYLQDISKDPVDDMTTEYEESSRLNSLPSEKSRSVLAMLPSRGNNLAAVLRCQASRHEHERDINIRTSLRRNEAREQAERHRLQMEMMLDRVTQIPTLFERHSQIYKSLSKMQSKPCAKNPSRRKKKLRRQNSSSIDSYISCRNASRPNSGSLTSSSGTLTSHSPSTKSSKSSESEQSSNKSISKFDNSIYKKKADRKSLKVSINETAELIEDLDQKDEKLSSNQSISEDRRDDPSQSDENDVVE